MRHTAGPSGIAWQLVHTSVPIAGHWLCREHCLGTLSYYGTLFWCVGTLWKDFVTQKTAPCPSPCLTRSDLCIHTTGHRWFPGCLVVISCVCIPSQGCFCFLFLKADFGCTAAVAVLLTRLERFKRGLLTLSGPPEKVMKK